MADALTLLLFAVGFALLIKGAGVLVRGATSLAGRLGVSAFLIGLTVVAFGTTVPELVVSVSAGLQGEPEIVLGNALGSIITNTLLVLGLASVLIPVVVRRQIFHKQLPIMLLAILVAGFLANDVLIVGSEKSVIDTEDGVILLSFFALYLYYVFSLARKGRHKKEIEQTAQVRRASLLKSLLLIALGIAGVSIGGGWVVDGAVHIASVLGVGETLIGLTIVAFGTSVPELATALTAIYRKASSLAVGNIIGANILNIFWILGVGATITAIPIDGLRNVDIGVLLVSTLLLFAFLRFSKGTPRIEKWQGALMLTIYGAFVLASIILA